MQFELQQRIRITAVDHPLFGYTGTVVQLRRSDNGAFVEMDRALLTKYPRLFKVGIRDRWSIILPDHAQQERTK